MAGVGEASKTDGPESDRKQSSEHFRKIAAKLKAYYESVGPTDIVFTSAVAGEGKTTSAVNCAISLCQDFGLSVCLVDLDLRNPQISRRFDLNGSVGIVEALRGEAKVESAIIPTTIEGLSVVYASGVETHILPLLNSDRFRRFVAELRSRFDFVIFDSSPVLPVVDTVVLSKYVSAVVLVIESGKTRKKHIEQLFEQIERDKVIGFVMNFSKSRMPKTYNYSKYYNYGQAEQ